MLNMNAIKLYRLERKLYLLKLTPVAKIVRGIIFLLYNSFIPYKSEIGKGTVFAYKGIGVIMHERAVIGENCTIGAQVTIGGKSGLYDVPKIGNNVYIATGAKVLGPVKIGNNVVIGANAIMINDAPNNTVWAGVPAKCIKKDIDDSYVV